MLRVPGSPEATPSLSSRASSSRSLKQHGVTSASSRDKSPSRHQMSPGSLMSAGRPRSPSSRQRSSGLTAGGSPTRERSSRMVRFNTEQQAPRRQSEFNIGTFRATIKFLGKQKKRLFRPKAKPKPKPPPEGFVTHKVEAWMQEMLDDMFEEYIYDAGGAGEEAKRASKAIIEAAKSRQLGRYKYVCHVTIGQDGQQGLELATRCLWNVRTDNYVCVSHVTKLFYAVAILHAVYFE